MTVTKPTANEVFRAENWAWGLFFAFKEPSAQLRHKNNQV